MQSTMDCHMLTINYSVGNFFFKCTCSQMFVTKHGVTEFNCIYKQGLDGI